MVRVRTARAAAEQVDDGTGSSPVGAATTGLGSGVLDLPDPPANASPEQSNSWWNGPSLAEQDRVVAEHPEWVGNRDGIPAAAREDSNRHLLATETQRLDRELADATTRWQDALDVPLSPGMTAARHGGADLARFIDGVGPSRDTDPHLTALGHSY